MGTDGAAPGSRKAVPGSRWPSERRVASSVPRAPRAGASAGTVTVVKAAGAGSLALDGAVEPAGAGIPARAKAAMSAAIATTDLRRIGAQPSGTGSSPPTGSATRRPAGSGRRSRPASADDPRATLRENLDASLAVAGPGQDLHGRVPTICRGRPCQPPVLDREPLEGRLAGEARGLELRPARVRVDVVQAQRPGLVRITCRRPDGQGAGVVG